MFFKVLNRRMIEKGKNTGKEEKTLQKSQLKTISAIV